MIREKATFAGGCFWCSEADFEKISGVIEVISGYTGGKEKNPSYEEVSSGKTSHREAIQIVYNKSKVSYGKLLEIFWKHIDPTDDKGQFVDKGFQYTSAIFYHNIEQKKLAEESKKSLEKSGKYSKLIATEIIKFESFYPAEEYHQDYYKKNPVRYNMYRLFSGRDKYVKENWDENDNFESGKYVKNNQSLKSKLTKLQYEVTQKEATEQPFKNEYWDNKKEGIYVDIASGEPLFSSKDKFDSGTGWPSFTKPLELKNIKTKEDKKLGMKRIEVKSKKSNNHLGHAFNDGPKPTGLRYCMNSAALRFIPKEYLEKEGYGKYRKLFE